MAATSPYQNNDYQAVSSYRPYRLPINDIFKAYSAQNQFWDAGAARVKSVYENALGLNLTNQTNREIRDKFMKDSEAQITKLSMMDLSDPSVQRQGIGIFKPLFQDEGVMSDHQATTWISELQSDIQRARTEKNGAGYADTNAMVAMEGAYEFQNSKDRMAGKTYLANKRSYTPYYNPSKEMEEIVKTCKGPKFSSTNPGSQTDMYLLTEEESGASPARLKTCLEAGLSQKAKDQIGIDGYAAYMTNNRIDHPDGKNYNALADDYMANAKGTLDGLTQTIGDLDGKILAFQKNYDQTQDKHWLEAKQAAQEMKDGYLGQYKNVGDAINQISSGNLDFIKKNYQTLAEQIFTNKRLGAFGDAFSTESTMKKYSADAVKLQQQRLVYDAEKTQMEFEQQKELKRMDLENQLKIEALKGSFKGKKVRLDANGNPIVEEELVPTTPPFTDEAHKATGYADFQKEKTDVLKQIDATNTEFFNNLKRKHPQEMANYTADMFFKPGGNGISPALSFLDANGRIAQEDPDVSAWSSQSALLTTKMNLLKAQEDANEAELKQRFPEIQKEKLDDKKVITIPLWGGGSDVIQLQKTGRQIADDVENGVATIGKTTNFDQVAVTYKINGKTYTIQTGVGNSFLSKKSDKENFEGMEKVIDFFHQKKQREVDMKGAQAEIYGRSMLTLRPDVYAEANNSDKEDPTRLRIKAALPGQFDMDNIQIISKDPTTGMATVSIKGNDKINIASEDAKKRIAQLTVADEVPQFDETKNEALVRIYSPSLIDKRTTENPMTMLQLYLDKLGAVVSNPLSSYAKVQPGQEIISVPMVTKTYGGNDFQIHVIRTSSGLRYEPWSKQKNNIYAADGTLQREKGKYYPIPGVSYSETNGLLGYLNGTQINTK